MAQQPSTQKATFTGRVVVRPLELVAPGGGPPSNSPGNPVGGGPVLPGCTGSDQFPDSGPTDAPITKYYQYTNPFNGPITFTDATLAPGDAHRWSADLSGIKGTIQLGQSVQFSVTFYPAGNGP